MTPEEFVNKWRPSFSGLPEEPDALFMARIDELTGRDVQEISIDLISLIGVIELSEDSILLARSLQRK